MSTSDMNSYRSALRMAVIAIVKECGFTDAEDIALESLVEMTQSLLVQLGKSSKHYSELANRSQVMLPDISLALVDAGISLEEIKSYSETHANRSSGLPPIVRESEPSAPRSLSVNKSGPLPQYVHDNLPSFPDKHTYIQTAAQRLPTSDYQLVREKAANEKKSAESALTRFIAKTGNANYYCDDQGNPIDAMFPLIACKPSALSYLPALLPKDENEYEVFDLKDEQELVRPSSGAKRLKTESTLSSKAKADNYAGDNKMDV